MAAVAAALAATAGTAAPAPGAPLRVDGQRLVDERGGTVLLRGTALIEKHGDGLPDVGAEDWRQMRELGFNTIRLGTAWEFVEPRPGEYDEAYPDALAALAREAMAEGFWVVVDMHQDVWGRPLGNGAAAWTVAPACAALEAVDLAQLTGAWALNYLSPWSLCQFTSFWADRGLQERFARAWAEIARRLAGAPRLAGYDLMNEPFQGAFPPVVFEYGVLWPFYDRVAAAIRSVDPDAVVFEEPANYKNVHLPTAPPPGARAGAVYAPHVYGLWDWSDAFSRRDELIALNMAWSGLEATLARVPLWYGEFGMRRSAPDAERSLTQIYDIADRQLAGTAYWEWSRGEYGPLRPDGSLDPRRALTLSRPYPARTGGALRSFSFDAADGVFSMRWRQVAGAGASEVVLPARRYGGGFTVDAGPGVGWTWDGARGVLVVEAEPGERRLTVRAAG